MVLYRYFNKIKIYVMNLYRAEGDYMKGMKNNNIAVMTPAEQQLAEYLDWCKNVRNMTECSIKCKKSTIELFIYHMEIDDFREIDENVINDWTRLRLTSELKGYKKLSPNGLISTKIQIMAFLRWLDGTQIGTKIRFPYVALTASEPVRRKFYNRKQILDVVKQCQSIEAKIAIMIAFETGLRIAEVANIQIEDICGRVIKTIGKGRKLGFVYISETTANFIQQYAIKKKCQKTLFKECDSLKIASARIVRIVKREFEKAGYPNFQFHELRHSFATDLQKHGAGIDEIQKLMRHSNPAVTDRYLHGLDGILTEVWDKYKNGVFDELVKKES